MKRTPVLACAALLLGLAFAVPEPAAALTETEVAEGLLCYACPGEPLNVDRCGGGDQMRAAIKRLIREGKTKEEILQYFAAQFGDGILTAPPKRGFNLVAYVGPFVGLVLGALIATLAVRRWSAAGRRSAPASPESPATQAPLDEAMKRRIEEELSKLDKEG